MTTIAIIACVFILCGVCEKTMLERRKSLVLIRKEADDDYCSTTPVLVEEK